MVELLFTLLVTGATLMARGAAGEFAKGGGKSSFEALKKRLAEEHGVKSLALLEEAKTNPVFAKAVKADLARPGIAKDTEVRRLAEALRGAIEALPDRLQAQYTVDIEEIRAGKALLRGGAAGTRAARSRPKGEQPAGGAKASAKSGGVRGFFKVVSMGGAAIALIAGIGFAVVTYVDVPDAIAKITAALKIDVAAPGDATDTSDAAAMPAETVAAPDVLTQSDVSDAPSAPFVRVDPGVVVARAEQQGHVSAEAAARLSDRVGRVETALDELRGAHPDWTADIDAAIAGFNAGQIDSAQAAFARIDALIAPRWADWSREDAQSKYVQATLFHALDATRSEPLLCAAATLAQDEAWYWIDCGQARMATGNTPEALSAFASAQDLAMAAGDDGSLSEALYGLGDARMAQGDPAGALAPYEQSLNIAREIGVQDVSGRLGKIGDLRLQRGDLAGAREVYAENLSLARDLAEMQSDNAERAWDVVIAHWRMAQADPENAAAHWAEVVTRMEKMQADATLLPANLQYLDIARQHLSAAQP
ncbi:hypothetical protein RGUI_3530 [Rhodovulum sp. P5]|uniref:tetratricopeptide repeat protein n=1 Tax=Rhodovulum sp. P5 TaxID=1564506 RepID=UPI0009C2EA71|nr:tetratricopeptide repeat protein [Rhodovulum sp. P5]ARE41671.1 hypothetical protein RGUI_3530 [Rhodovulum sp. P5]